MIISLIAAVDQVGGIGKDGKVPWYISADLKYFKRITMGHTIIMGRKTFESIGKALPGRTNLILSAQSDFQPADTIIFQSLDSALIYARDQGEEEVFIIGGEKVFHQALPLAQRLYLTKVDGDYRCDVFFPQFDITSWQVVESDHHPKREKQPISFTFQVLEKIRK